jgi:hypothetical protein
MGGTHLSQHQVEPACNTHDPEGLRAVTPMFRFNAIQAKTACCLQGCIPASCA